jgi:peptidoglycan-associated lipoprotein
MCTLVATLALSGCRRRVPDQPVPVVQLPESVGPAPDSVDRDAARRDSIAREERLRAERERMAAARATLQEPVYFDYDRADLSAEAKRALDAKRTLLAASADVMLRIAGHADERGSDEYNVALGQRRAVAAKRYLVDHGIDPGRLDVVSFGEERPVCTVSAESCWRRNRRAEFEITAGFGPVAGH